MDPVEILRDLIEIDTRNPPGNTESAVEYIENLFSSYRTKVVGKDGKTNIIVEISRGEPEFLFTSHLDTVPSDDSMLTAKISDGKVYGRGSCDAKGCVSSIISAFYGMESDKGIKLAFTADEEVGGKLGLGMVMEYVSPDFVVIGEPFGSDRIGVAQASVVALKLIVHGKSGHTATADIREGAVYRAASLIINAVNGFSAIKGERDEYIEKLTSLGFDVEFRGNGDAVFNPSIVRAGVKRNVVPEFCEIDADVRVAPWVSMERVRSILKYDGVDVFITGYLRPFGYGLDGVDTIADIRLLNIMKNAIMSENMRPKAVVSLGVGDSRHVRVKGTPAFYYGPGGENMHSNNEFVYVDEMKRAVRVYRRMVTL